MKKETAVSKGIRDRITITLHDNKEVNFDQYNSQCAPGIFNLDQKFHRVSCFWGFQIYKRIQNQSRKTSVIGLPKE